MTHIVNRHTPIMKDNKSETPETDSYAWKDKDGFENVRANTARQFERERNEARINFEAEKERGDTNAEAWRKANEALEDMEFNFATSERELQRTIEQRNQLLEALEQSAHWMEQCEANIMGCGEIKFPDFWDAIKAANDLVDRVKGGLQ